MSEKPHDLYLIAHTHWDREWYLPFQQFRVHLVHLIDSIISLMEGDLNPPYRHFNLDAQTIVIEDYLDIRPEMQDTVVRLVQDQRIGIGPWYCQPDEWTAGELIARNLLRGHRLMNKYGGGQRIGYCPDLFGHVSQMPQILTLAGLDTFMFFRGLGDELVDPQFTNEFYWEGPDGSRVLAFFMPGGYANAKNHPEEQFGFNSAMLFAFSRQYRSKTHVHFIGCGGDHYIPQPSTAAFVEGFNADEDALEELGGGKLHFASLTEFFDAIKAREDPADSLFTIRGELRNGRSDVFAPGSISSRMYLKQANGRGWRKLCYLAEPVTAWLWLQSQYTQKTKGFLDLAWKFLLQNQPHDSICGCSVDPVHRDMESRFEQSEEIVDELVQESLQTIQVCQPAFPATDIPVVIFIPHAHPTRNVVQAMFANQKFHYEAEIIFAAGLDLKKTYEVRDADGTVLPSCSRIVCYKDDHDMLQVTWLTGETTGMGYATYFLCEQGTPDDGNVIEPLLEMIYENDWARVEFNPDGTFFLYDKVRNISYPSLHYFEDQADAGDGYDFYGLPTDLPLNTLNINVATITSIKHRFGAEFTVNVDFSLPRALDPPRKARLADIVTLPIKTTITIWDHVPRIDFRTEVENCVFDHRLRAVFPTHLQADYVYAASIYDVIERGIGTERVEARMHEWIQQNPPTSHVSEFVDLYDATRGAIAVFNKGLPEYEARRGYEEGITLLQTLFRAVRYEGGFLPKRGGAGPPIPTPDSQLQRKMVCEYALFFHSDSWAEDHLYCRANEFILPLGISGGTVNIPGRPAGQIDPLEMALPPLPPAVTLITITNPNVILTTFKQAEEGRALVMRVFNPTEIPQETEISLGFPVEAVQYVNLVEEPLTPEDENLKLVNRNHVGMLLPAKKIVSCLLQPA